MSKVPNHASNVQKQSHGESQLAAILTLVASEGINDDAIAIDLDHVIDLIAAADALQRRDSVPSLEIKRLLGKARAAARRARENHLADCSRRLNRSKVAWKAAGLKMVARDTGEEVEDPRLILQATQITKAASKPAIANRVVRASR